MRLSALLMSAWLGAGLIPVAPALAQSDAEESAVLRFLQGDPDFLNRHPDLMAHAAEYRNWNRMADARAGVRASLTAAQSLLESPLTGRAGAGDLRIIEFLDYRCPPCRASASALTQVLHDDPRLQVVYLPFPLFGDESELAATAAFAAQLQGRFAAMHEALISAPVVDRRAVIAIAQRAGLDVNRLLADMSDPRFATLVRQTQALARALNVAGAPAFVVGDLFVEGGVDAPRLRKSVALARCLSQSGISAKGSGCLAPAR
jgi:protein-disulfide isomerase